MAESWSAFIHLNRAQHYRYDPISERGNLCRRRKFASTKDQHSHSMKQPVCWCCMGKGLWRDYYQKKWRRQKYFQQIPLETHARDQWEGNSLAGLNWILRAGIGQPSARSKTEIMENYSQSAEHTNIHSLDPDSSFSHKLSWTNILLLGTASSTASCIICIVTCLQREPAGKLGESKFVVFTVLHCWHLYMRRLIPFCW